MRVLIPIPVWKRPNILLHCLKGMHRFVRESKKYKIVVIPFFIISPDDCFYETVEYMIHSSGFDYCIYDNYPVGRKLNAGINLAMELFDFDYIMNAGSDNIINPEIWKYYKTLMKQNRQLFGLMNFHAYGTVEKEALYFNNYNKDRAAGTGRMIHINSIKKVKKHCDLYPNVDSGMDTLSGNNIVKYCNVSEKVIDTDYPLILGLKSATNINPYPDLLKRKEKITIIDFNSIKKYFYDNA